jgi:hypothetical protein
MPALFWSAPAERSVDGALTRCGNPGSGWAFLLLLLSKAASRFACRRAPKAARPKDMFSYTPN